MNQSTIGRHQRWVIMTAVFIATFMTSVEVTIVTTALPSIISELHGLAYQSWIMSAYLLTTAITTPIYGKMADALGRRNVFQWGVIVFTIGSLLSGLSPSILFLILARAIQGIGAGAVMPLTFTIIADIFTFKERANVLALNNTAWGLSALVGPLIGGFLVDHLSWHWVFFVNVPLGLIVAVLVWLGYHENIELSSRLTIDWWGILWLAISLVTLLLGIQALDTMPALGIGLLLITIIAVVLFIRQEKRFVDPLISPKMFMSKTFTIQIMTATILSGVLIGYQMYFPIWLQSLYRVSATTAGLVVTSSSIMWLAASFLVGKLINRYVPKQIAIALIGVMLLSYLSLIFASRTFPVWSFYVIAMINGIGMGVVVSMNTILSQHLVPNDMVGSATSVLTLGRSLGQTVMAGVYGAILNLVIRMQLHGGITFSQVNNVISTKGTAVVVNRSLIDPIILTALHMVFVGVVAMLVVVFVINLLDPNHKIIR
ncbi:MFS transporter [Lentilactobacillus otakiensis]|uniref:Major facilitator superfamily protein n=1 Tax=Lentilactobacillus otakiensis DSM 19908 = JCM 15040 TaxID=1423780 RepID=S4NGW2_9LACO|nr:MFS transporter [Lentilactobacillus otakiensis]KRL10116.1 major facilitator superfamily protein [Lentilactobacillus otakiensis DSM 19908 = JCM 15040]MBZ3776373.1 MFS transporter [Lentilactobacillus otakiensis]MDV3517968.1 MFS transporter [Lentilactobacillus otakiensis]GAD16472.1 major facilitator superfamily protein [Lentilactobacillus otakiensis DSM 19908 = JCM 15040]